MGMKRWGVLVGLLVAADAALRLLGHHAFATGVGRGLVAGLHLAAVPLPAAGGLGLGPIAWSGVCLALSLLAAGAFLLTAALLDVRGGPAVRLGLAAALLAIATNALDLVEWVLAGAPLALLAWRPETAAARLFAPADLLLPAALVTLGLAWVWLVLGATGWRDP